jgi:hypothetical protein
LFWQVAIQRDIACSPFRNHQFTQVAHWPTDQWVLRCNILVAFTISLVAAAVRKSLLTA